jgi:hypothetical protein
MNMPDDKKTQDPEVKGQEDEKKKEEEGTEDPVDEQGQLFSEGFADAIKKNKGESTEGEGEDKGKATKKEGEEETDKGGKAGEGKEKEEDGAGAEGKKTAKEKSDKEGEGEEKGEAEKEIEARGARLQKIMAKSQEGEGEGEGEGAGADDKKKSKTKTKEKEPDAKGKGGEGEGEEFDPMKGVELSEAEKEFLVDMPEVSPILSKILKNALKGIGGKSEGVSQEVLTHLEEQDGVIANLRTQVALSRLVPDYEEIVYDGNKMLESGERAPNPIFWTWLKDQPDLYQALALSENPRDNAAVLKYYKEEKAKKQLSEKDKKQKEKLDKTKDLHSHSANASKTTKKKSGEVDEDDFSGGFAEATKKIAAERQ